MKSLSSAIVAEMLILFLELIGGIAGACAGVYFVAAFWQFGILFFLATPLFAFLGIWLGYFIGNPLADKLFGE